MTIRSEEADGTVDRAYRPIRNVYGSAFRLQPNARDRRAANGDGENPPSEADD